MIDRYYDILKSNYMTKSDTKIIKVIAEEFSNYNILTIFNRSVSAQLYEDIEKRLDDDVKYKVLKIASLIPETATIAEVEYLSNLHSMVVNVSDNVDITMDDLINSPLDLVVYIIGLYKSINVKIKKG